MAAVPPGQPIAPGIASGNTYPQYGVMQSGSKYSVKEAKNAAQKQADTNAGFLVWFGSDSAAKNFISSETSLLNGNVPSPAEILGLPELSNLRNLVIRSAKVIAGMLLIAIGAVKLFHVEDAVKDVAPVVAKAAVL